MSQIVRQTSQTDEPVLTVVIVNYNGWADVVRLTTTLAEAPEVLEGRCELVVVDNASESPPPNEILPPPSGVRLVLRDENGGFAAGVNAGWRASRGRWLLLLNPDVVAGPEVIGQILERVEQLACRKSPLPGIVGFGLRNPDGTHQPSVGAEPGLARAIWESFLPRSRRKYKIGWGRRAGVVPWVTGACALVDANLLDKLGGMDEDFFLYYEEVALCQSARRAGRHVEFDPSVEVTHLRPLQNRRISPKIRVFTRHSRLLYFHKYLSRREFVCLAWMIAIEARVRGRWSKLLGRDEEQRAWKAVGQIARTMGRGGQIRGRQVLHLAESAIEGRPIRIDAGNSSRRHSGKDVLNAFDRALTRPAIDGRTQKVSLSRLTREPFDT